MQRNEYNKERAVGDGRGLLVGVVVSEFNHDITEPMLEGALSTLAQWRVKEKRIHVVQVPGSFEIPLAAQQLIKRKKVNVVLAIGCIIKGETKHDEYIAHAVSQALQRIMLDTGIPIGFGIITPNTLAQAKVRSGGSANKGSEAAHAALQMATLKI